MKREAALLACCLLAFASTAAEERIVDIRQGTNMALALSPDGASLIVDLLGQLWRLPVQGGGALPLTEPREMARQPRFSPDGQRIVYQQLADGQWDLWEINLADGTRRRLTETPFDEREPDYSADGRAVVFASNREDRFELWSLDLAGGALRRLTWLPGDKSFPSVSEFGEIAYVNHHDRRWSLRVLAPNGDDAELISGSNALAAPSWRPGGAVLVFNEQEGARRSDLRLLVLADRPVLKTLTRAEDIFAARPAWADPGELLYTADGQIWRRGLALTTRYPVHMFAGITVETSGPPRTAPELHEPGPHPVRGIVDVAVSPADDDMVAFTALGDLWLLEGRGEPRRLTDDAFVEFDATFTPEGDALVFASDRGGRVDLWQMDLEKGQTRRLTSSTLKSYHPAVSPDGRYVAFLETADFGPWGKADVKLLALTGQAQVDVLAQDLLDPGVPVWEADGTALALDARNVDSDGGPGPLRRLRIDVASGAREWQEGGAPEALPIPVEVPDVELFWEAHDPGERYVVQVGRLFDGIRNQYRRHVDIHVEGRRIVAVTSRGMGPSSATVIDARDHTVIPGLIDLHAHQSSLTGERLGRLWLAYGITTVREIGRDWREGLERSEAWASGRRLGPRLIVSPAGSSAEHGAVAGPGITEALSHTLQRWAARRVAPQWQLLPPGLELLEYSAEPRYRLELSPLRATYQDVIGTLTASGMVVIPTLAALTQAAPRIGRGLDNPYAALLHPEEQARWSAPRPGTLEMTGTLKDTLTRLIRNGGRVASGSEAPAVPYGLGLHDELALLADAGIPNDQVLRLATIEGALALGLDAHIGTLEAGKLADFVVLRGNPLERIADTRSIVAVVKEGRWLDRSQLLAGP